MSYSDWMEPDRQITTEELISALIFDYEYDDTATLDGVRPLEHECMDMGKRILALVLSEFRPDLIADDEWSWE